MANLSPAPGTEQTATKATVGGVITSIGALVTLLVATVPDNDNVQLWGAVVVGALTVAANVVGVYQAKNKAKPVAVVPAKVKDGNDWEKPGEAGQHSPWYIVGWLVVALLALIILFWVIIPALNDHNDRDGMGNDWERVHHSITKG